jgi:hypothetical protein
MSWVRRYTGPIVVLVSLITLAVVALLTFRTQPASKQGTLVFSDDFNRTALGSQYLPAAPDRGHKAGTWRIEDGRLKAENIHNAVLWLQEALPEQVRVEFTSRAESATGDVKCEIFGDGKTHQSGYILIFGGWHNTVNAIARQDEHGEDRKQDSRCGQGRQRRCVEPKVDYQWAVERTDDTVRWYLDGQLFLTFPDAHPIRGRFFGFSNWEAPVTFDDLRIYDLGR